MDSSFLYYGICGPAFYSIVPAWVFPLHPFFVLPVQSHYTDCLFPVSATYPACLSSAIPRFLYPRVLSSDLLEIYLLSFIPLFSYIFSLFLVFFCQNLLLQLIHRYRTTSLLFPVIFLFKFIPVIYHLSFLLSFFTVFYGVDYFVNKKMEMNIENSEER